MSDTQLIDALSFVLDSGGRVEMTCDRTVFSGDLVPSWGYAVAGGSLGGAHYRTLREAITDWAQSLIKLSELDPEHYARFAAIEAT